MDPQLVAACYLILDSDSEDDDEMETKRRWVSSLCNSRKAESMALYRKTTNPDKREFDRQLESLIKSLDRCETEAVPDKHSQLISILNKIDHSYLEGYMQLVRSALRYILYNIDLGSNSYYVYVDLRNNLYPHPDIEKKLVSQPACVLYYTLMLHRVDLWLLLDIAIAKCFCNQVMNILTLIGFFTPAQKKILWNKVLNAPRLVRDYLVPRLIDVGLFCQSHTYAEMMDDPKSYEACRNPMSLQKIARLAVRNQMANISVLRNCYKLHIPVVLKEYLSFKSLHAHVRPWYIKQERNRKRKLKPKTCLYHSLQNAVDKDCNIHGMDICEEMQQRDFSIEDHDDIGV